MQSTDIDSILQDLACGHSLTEEHRSHLSRWMLANPGWSSAFGITPDTVADVINEQSTLYPQIYPIVTQFWCQHSPMQIAVLKLLWVLWLPLALQLISAHHALGRPLIQGVLGVQGSGKSTFSQVLTLILTQLSYPSLSLSLDDLYLTYAERQQEQLQDPRLRWRGPPGTHDVLLGIRVLDQLRSPFPPSQIAIPRFDKSAQDGQGDRRGFESVAPVKIVLFEGWFVGVRPIAPSQFEAAPEPIHSAQDRQFARDMNAKLRDYLPLWERLDRLIVLNLADYRLSKQWRREAEHQAITAGKSGMSDAEIDQFVEYFWRALHPQLFIPPLLQTNQWVDWVIEIDAGHAITGIHQINGLSCQNLFAIGA